MLMQKNSSVLLIVDIQEKLTPNIINFKNMLYNCEWLMKLANKLSVPTLISEQYPAGLGQTVKSLKNLANSYSPLEKIHFSCYQDENFIKKLEETGKTQVIIAGIESHVCVMQTAINLKQSGKYDVFVVVDAVGSRNQIDNKYALKRMKKASVELVTSEMVFFEWLNKAGTPEFKALSKEFLLTKPINLLQ